jgi:penicillin amidase
VRDAFASALTKLASWGGEDVATWRWGRLHQITHPHPMASSAPLRELYNTGPFPTSGGPPSVRAASYGLTLPFAVTGASTYRFQADLSRPDGMRSVQTLGQSAHLGSPHYRDQTKLWLADRYHPFWMSEADVLANLESETTIRPAGND